MPYTHSSIVINNRVITIKEIVGGNAPSYSEFESGVFSFLKDWMSDRQEFELNTSGSTGAPKTITVNRKMMIDSALRTIEALGLTNDDTALTCLDTRFIAGKMMLVRAVTGNLKIVGVDPCSNPIRNLPQDIDLDFAAFVPLQLQAIVDDPASLARLHEMKSVIIGGSQVGNGLQNRLQSVNAVIYETYGMTETLSHVALKRLNGKHDDKFHTLPGIKIKQDDRRCLIIDIPGLHEIITNDIVEIFTPTSFLWLGRLDNIINTGGVKVSPEKIESKIAPLFERLNIHNSFMIVGFPDERLGQKVVLLIEGSLGNTSIDKISIGLAELIDPYSLPRSIHCIDHFTYTGTGKINRKATLGKVLVP